MRKINLDTCQDKEKYKERIAESIGKRLPDAEMSEIKKAIDQTYEYWLLHSHVKQHIPTITEHKITAIFREKMRRSVL